MPLRNTSARYGAVHQALHWSMALLIVALFATEQIMHHEAMKPPTKWWWYDLHKSLGITILMLVAFRLFWRQVNPLPAAPSMPRWQRLAAKASHGLLYTAMIVMPVSGFIGSKAGGFKAGWFGLFEMPDLFGKSEALNFWAEAVHTYTSYMLYALVFLHVGAAFYHHYGLRDSVLRRMLPVRLETADQDAPT